MGDVRGEVSAGLCAWDWLMVCSRGERVSGLDEIWGGVGIWVEDVGLCTGEA